MRLRKKLEKYLILLWWYFPQISNKKYISSNKQNKRRWHNFDHKNCFGWQGITPNMGCHEKK